MKIAVGGIYHETHSFSNVPTTVKSFEDVLLLQGRDVIEQLRSTTSEMAGFLEGAERFGFSVVPTVWAWAVSTGPVEAEALDYFISVVKTCIEREGAVDGVLFALHGACVSTNDPDGDGYILSRLRDIVGDRTPIAITLDFHANISERMVELADIVVGYDTYPHVDQVERGYEAAELIVRTVKGEIRPTMALEKPPMLIVPMMQLTTAYPMSQLIDLAHQCESEALSVTVSGGFVYSDVREAGPGVVVITNDQQELAREIAREISARMWELRESFIPSLPSVSEAVARGMASQGQPVVLADVGDNIGAGTPGDGTVILKELIARGAQGAVVVIADSASVAAAAEVGVGRRVMLSVGGKTDGFHGEPVSLECYVKLISDGVFVNRGQMRNGIKERMGRTAVVEHAGIKIVLTEIKSPPWNLEQLRSLGITPECEKIIVVKSAVAFRAAYEPIAHEILEVNSPGLSTVDLRQFDYKNIRSPLYPLNKP